MILSVSRRTDIPSYYSEWFYNRIKEGFVYVRNPMNPGQVSRIELSPEVVDCIVFWTKNPEPMLDRLEELSDYNYYFHFTLTGYGKDVESNIPHKKEIMLPIFQRLSEKIGRHRVIWRYDPIMFTPKYTAEYHLKAFELISKALNGYTTKCVISFVDTYVKNQKSMKAVQAYDLSEKQLKEFAGKLSEIASKNGMEISSCAEKIDLTKCGIKRSSCIDKELIEEIIGCKLKAEKDKNQRPECGCIESIDIGAYDTCKNGCIYCYANNSFKSIRENCSKYEAYSPLLCGILNEDDKIHVRKVKSHKEEQMSLFEI